MVSPASSPQAPSSADTEVPIGVLVYFISLLRRRGGRICGRGGEGACRISISTNEIQLNTNEIQLNTDEIHQNRPDLWGGGKGKIAWDIEVFVRNTNKHHFKCLIGHRCHLERNQ